jgi:CBS domain-containing membrane protein
MQTSVATVRVGETLLVAEDLMRTGWVRHVPVIDAIERVLGVLTQRDVLRVSMPPMAEVGPVDQQRWLERLLVRDVMSKKPVTIGPEADLVDAVDKLLAGKFGCLPVVEGGKLVGLITEMDLLQHLRTLLKKRTRLSVSSRTRTKKQALSM